MQDMITVYIERACFFMIIAELLVQFAASSKYEKYISLLTGILCITILIVPIGEFFFQSKLNHYVEKTDEFEQKLSELMKSNNIYSRESEYKKLQADMENQIIDEAYLQKEEEDKNIVQENNRDTSLDESSNIKKVEITGVHIETESSEGSQ